MESQQSLENSSQPFSIKELDFLLDKVKERPLTKSDIMNIAEDIAGSKEYLRTFYSAQISLTVLHTLAHGILPHGVMPQNGQWQVPSRTMIEHTQSRGYDCHKHMELARADLEERIRVQKNKKTRKAAITLLSEYFRANRKLLRGDVADFREDIINDIMNGVEVTEAFSRYLK